jgi:hypothetical protein
MNMEITTTIGDMLLLFAFFAVVCAGVAFIVSAIADGLRRLKR